MSLRPGGRRPARGSGVRRSRGGEDSSDEEEAGEDEPEARRETPSKRKRSEEEQGEEAQSKRSRQEEILAPEQQPAPVTVDEERYKHFMGLLNKCVSEKNQAQELEMSVIRSFLAKNEKKKPFTEAEIDACIERMSDENKVMRSEDTVFIIV